MFFLLQPVGRVSEVPLLIMAIIGIIDFWRERKEILKNDGFILLLFFFLLLWVPVLASLFGSYNLERSLSTAFGMLRFFFAGVFLLYRLNTQDLHDVLVKLFLGIVVFWCMDGVVQLILGFDIFGIESRPGRITGVFSQDDGLGYFLLPLAGVALVSTSGFIKHWILFLLVLLVFFVIVASGDRGAWVGLFWGGLAAVIMLFLRGVRVSAWRVVALLFIPVMVMVGALQTPVVEKRVNKTVQAFTGVDQGLDSALSGRATLWSTTLTMIENNPINGVGARAFRWAYPDYAEVGDHFVTKHKDGTTIGAYYAHQIVLEIMSETGVIGLIGLILLYARLIFLGRDVLNARSLIPLGYYVSVIAIIMPINSHWALLSSKWGGVFWMALFLFISALNMSKFERSDI